MTRILGHDDDARHAFGRKPPADGGHGEAALDRLAAGHGDGVVEQQLVGDVDTGGNGGTDGEQSRVVVRPVADIGEDMGRLGEWRLADPTRPFTAHLRQRPRIWVRPQRQRVATDAGERAGAFGDAGRRVVRAAGAEMWRPSQGRARGRWRRLRDAIRRQTKMGRQRAGDSIGR
jgi:hypothetical protein